LQSWRGILELAINNNQIGAAKFTPAKLGTQAILNESQLVFTPSAVASFITETNGTRLFDYVSRNFTITNNTGGTVNNLTLVALAKTGNIGGTAIRVATAFNGSATDATTAQLARPTHTMIASSGAAAVDTADISRASFQALTAAEALAIQNDSNFASQNLTGTVLEYGFVATNTAGTGRGIANGSSGKVSIAMRFPKPTTATNTYNFVMTFAVTAESANRVTRSPEETTTAANTRATTLGATQKVLIDDTAVITGTNIPSGYTVQGNVKIGIGVGQTLLKKAAKLVLARVSVGGGYTNTPFVYNSDFVEIFNSGEFSASLNGMSLQGANLSAELGVSPFSVDVSALGIISPGQYKLVSTTSRVASDPTITPASEISTLWNVNFNFANGARVALVNQTAALGCGGTAATACNATQNSKIVDLLGYKKSTSTITLVQFEGTSNSFFTYPTDSGELAFSRKDKGCLDANVNSSDFSVETITNTSARNSSSPVFVCP
jgi:hypothetical protein